MKNKVVEVLQGRDINLEELREFCKCSNLKFGVIQMGPNCDSMLLETERGSIDTMNSFWTIFCAYLVSSLDDTYQ